jgi:hypothetical protein
MSHRKVAARMFVLSEAGDRVSALEDKKVVRVELNFLGKLELSPIAMDPTLGDWGYDELTAPERGPFRHEIILASGGDHGL